MMGKPAGVRPGDGQVELKQSQAKVNIKGYQLCSGDWLPLFDLFLPGMKPWAVNLNTITMGLAPTLSGYCKMPGAVQMV